MLCINIYFLFSVLQTAVNRTMVRRQRRFVLGADSCRRLTQLPPDHRAATQPVSCRSSTLCAYGVSWPGCCHLNQEENHLYLTLPSTGYILNTSAPCYWSTLKLRDTLLPLLLANYKTHPIGGNADQWNVRIYLESGVGQSLKSIHCHLTNIYILPKPRVPSTTLYRPDMWTLCCKLSIALPIDSVIFT